MRYIWDNYIYPNDANYFFVLGIGDAYTGLMNLLNLDETIADSTDFIYSFVADNTLQAVKKQTDDGLISDWYRRHSLIFVSESHAVWDPNRQRKVSKKYGTLVKSAESNIDRMLLEHKTQVFAHLENLTAAWREEQEHKNANSNPTNAADKIGLGLGPLHSATRVDDDAMLDGTGNGNGRLRDGSRTSTPNPGGNSGRRSPTKLPPIGTFEVASPLRSPNKRPPFS